MRGERQIGPIPMSRLADLGVTPDTWIWSKGMAGWIRADEDADICRIFRQRLAELQHPVTVPTVPAGSGGMPPHPTPTPEPGSREELRQIMAEAFSEAPDPAEEDPDMPPPRGLLFVAILATIFCFPITGAVAIWHAVTARRLWKEAERSTSKSSGPLYSESERTQLRNEMAASIRSAKMWTGITIFVGLISYAAMIHLI